MAIPLRFTFDGNEVRIEGNEEGLRCLADCCLRIIGKEGPAGHFHLMSEMNNLMKDSVTAVIKYSEKLGEEP
jgi:hypothetical protein